MDRDSARQNQSEHGEATNGSSPPTAATPDPSTPTTPTPPRLTPNPMLLDCPAPTLTPTTSSPPPPLTPAPSVASSHGPKAAVGGAPSPHVLVPALPKLTSTASPALRTYSRPILPSPSTKTSPPSSSSSSALPPSSSSSPVGASTTSPLLSSSSTSSSSSSPTHCNTTKTSTSLTNGNTRPVSTTTSTPITPFHTPASPPGRQVSQSHPVGSPGLARANQSPSPVRPRVSQQTLLLGKGLKGSGQDQVLLRAQMLQSLTLRPPPPGALTIPPSLRLKPPTSAPPPLSRSHAPLFPPLRPRPQPSATATESPATPSRHLSVPPPTLYSPVRAVPLRPRLHSPNGHRVASPRQTSNLQPIAAAPSSQASTVNRPLAGLKSCPLTQTVLGQSQHSALSVANPLSAARQLQIIALSSGRQPQAGTFAHNAVTAAAAVESPELSSQSKRTSSSDDALPLPPNPSLPKTSSPPSLLSPASPPSQAGPQTLTLKGDMKEGDEQRSRAGRPVVREEKDPRPGVREEKDPRPGVREEKDPRPGVREEKDPRPGVREEKDPRPGVREEKDPRPGVREEKELRPAVREEKDLRPGVRQDKDPRPGVREEKELRPEVREEKDPRPGVREEKDLKPGVREEKDLRTEGDDQRVKEEKPAEKEISPKEAEDDQMEVTEEGQSNREQREEVEEKMEEGDDGETPMDQSENPTDSVLMYSNPTPDTVKDSNVELKPTLSAAVPAQTPLPVPPVPQVPPVTVSDISVQNQRLPEPHRDLQPVGQEDFCENMSTQSDNQSALSSLSSQSPPSSPFITPSVEPPQTAHPTDLSQSQRDAERNDDPVSESQHPTEAEAEPLDQSEDESESFGQSLSGPWEPRAWPEGRQVLTHLVEGFVIQEGLQPFPVNRSSLLVPDQVTKPQEVNGTNGRAALPVTDTIKPTEHSTDSDEEDGGDTDDPGTRSSQRDRTVLHCQFCGKRGHAHNFMRSKRFCSTSCARGFNVRLTKRLRALSAGSRTERPRPALNRAESVPGKPLLLRLPRDLWSAGRREKEGKEKPTAAPEEEDEEEEEEDMGRGGEEEDDDDGGEEDPAVAMAARMERRAVRRARRASAPAVTTTTPTSTFKPAPSQWSVEEVSAFILTLPGCSDVAEAFRLQEIDGQALLLLTEDHLMTSMNIKLGPALKICAHINALKNP
ncbi:polyhomeotic-like protein 2 isoform X3 [Acanthochromis polyacanthus]|uniref:polyhomeotic-like protein 2 isoform X3 n=1 Tax=Acanthochromis polyacanthus TaxID=80966 RepID=UPI0022340CAE|nr:polyhomeotic-like protein 2 isoform X3 [Acanthochromis polyacanthus]